MTPTSPARGPAVLLASLPILALLAATPLRAQDPAPPRDSAAAAERTVVLAGVVRDTAGRPLSGAEVRAGARFTLSERDGTFLLTGVTRDTVQLLVRRIGYRPADVLLAVEPHVRRVELAVRMVPALVELGTIVVEGRTLSTPLWRNGFYDRQRAGSGTFFDAQFLKRFAGSVGVLMYEVPSVRVSRGRFNALVPMGPTPGGGYCALNVFLDGVLVRYAAEIGIDQLVAKEDVLGIEVYPRATQVPSVLAGATGGVESVGGGLPPMGAGSAARGLGNVDCGAVVIWTRPVGSQDREP